MSATLRSLAALLALGLSVSMAACSDDPPPDDGQDDGGGPIACENQSQCGEGQRCEGGLCVENKCSSSAECPSGFTCDVLHGECKQSTTTTPDGGVDPVDGGHTNNPDGGIPNTGSPCTTKYDCADGQICKQGKCANPPTSNTCNADVDCPRGKICNFSKQCEAGCTDPKDCNAPELCHPQKFVCEKCSLTNPCPNVNGQPQQCVGGQCKAAVSCTSAQDCVNKGLDGAVCTGGFCGNCSAHGDCLVDPYKNDNPKRVCGLDGLCKKVNCSDSQCQNTLGPRGYCDTSANPPACSQYQCLADSDCTAPQKCNLADHTCTDTPDNCDFATCDQQCQAQVDPLTGAPGSCNQATCSCQGGGGLPGGGGMCTTDADCPQGQACALGLCTDQAVAPDGSACDAATCLFGGLLGAPCVSASDPTYECDPIGCGMSLLFGGGSGAAPCL